MRRSAILSLPLIVMWACQPDDLTRPGAGQGPDSALRPAAAVVVNGILDVDPGYAGWSEAYAINNTGQIVGWRNLQQNALYFNADFIWDATNGIRRLFWEPDWSQGTDINDSGQVAGSHAYAGWFYGPAANTPIHVPMPASPTGVVCKYGVHAINDAGIVIGGQDNCSYTQPFIWNSVTGQVSHIPLGGALARDINNNGQAVLHTFYWNGSYSALYDIGSATLTQLPRLAGGATEAHGINDAGQVVGFSVVAGFPHAFLWDAVNGMRDLGTLGGTSSAASAINEHGHVVGWSLTATGTKHAFAWDPITESMLDLGTLAGDSSVATDINDFGQATGWSTTANGMHHAVIWSVSFPGATPTGTNVGVQPVDETTGDAAPVDITFDNVTAAGETIVSSGAVGQGGSPPSPDGFRLGNPPTYFDVETTATFTGSVTLCFDYSGVSYGNENRLELLHFENGGWVVVTTFRDPANDIICGTVSALSPFLVAEENVAPEVVAIALPGSPVPLGSGVALSAAFTDANPIDTHTADVVWDDGSTSAADITESGGTGSLGAQHTYASPGVYTIAVSVSDGELTGSRSSHEDQPAYIVVYDPSAGFVTGGGWFDSPEGACQWSGCAADGSTTGKASFGFVSRHHKGATTPSGHTEFQFKAGDLTFRSTSYQWLVVAGARAQYKGEGEIAGSTDGYGFLITAIDGAIVGGGDTDRFRIKLWNMASGDVVYDNQMGDLEDSNAATVLSGGSIVIHAKALDGATTITPYEGDGQSADIGFAVAVAPSVRVTDKQGNPVSGVAVTFTPTAGGGSITDGSAMTDAAGIATVGSWTVGWGTNRLEASAPGLAGSPVIFTATGIGWHTMAPMLTPRWLHGAGALNGELYAVGGDISSNNMTTSVEAYDPIANSWTYRASMPTRRGYLGVTASNGLLYAAGGYDLGTVFATFEAYDPATDTWSSRAPMPTARMHVQLVEVDGLIYAIGGRSSTGNPLGVVEVYDPSTDTWSTRTPMPTPRYGHQAAMVDGIIYVAGGITAGLTVTTLEAYDPMTDTWTTKAPLSSKLTVFGMGVVDGIIFIAGGYSSAPHIDAHSYDPATDTWTGRAPMSVARSGVAAGVVGGAFYVIGGHNGFGPLGLVEAYQH